MIVPHSYQPVITRVNEIANADGNPIKQILNRSFFCLVLPFDDQLTVLPFDLEYEIVLFHFKYVFSSFIEEKY